MSIEFLQLTGHIFWALLFTVMFLYGLLRAIEVYGWSMKLEFTVAVLLLILGLLGLNKMYDFVGMV